MSKFNELRDIIKEKNYFNTKQNWYNLTGWRELNFDKMKEVLNFINEYCIKLLNGKERSKSENCWNLRLKIEETKSTEQEMERKIVNKMSEKIEIYNQFNLLSGIINNQQRTSIDIVICENNIIYEMIELKWNNENDNPLSSALEILFYFIIYSNIKIKEIVDKNGKQGPALNDKIKLIVLANSTYYNYFNCLEKLEIIKKFFNLNFNKKIEFNFQELDNSLEKLNRNDNHIKKLFNEKKEIKL